MALLCEKPGILRGLRILGVKTKIFLLTPDLPSASGLFNASIFTPPLCLNFSKKSKFFEHNYALIFISHNA